MSAPDRGPRFTMRSRPSAGAYWSSWTGSAKKGAEAGAAGQARPVALAVGRLVGYRRRYDAGGDRRPRALAAGARPDRPRLRTAPRCPGHGTCGADVARALRA